MTSSLRSDATEACPKCAGPTAWRKRYPYPVKTQIVFAASFILFLLFSDRIRAVPGAVGAWCVGQVALGFVLVRLRLRTRHRVLRCIRCGEAVP
jgi:hypothetical protein